MKAFFILLCFVAISTINCKKPGSDNVKPNKEPIVLNVYDYNNDLVAHYKYNDKNQLLKREFTDPVNHVSSNLIFHYTNDLLTKVEYEDISFPQFSHQKHYYYNGNGQINKIETYQNGNLRGTFQLNFNQAGKLESVNPLNNAPNIFYSYDANGNVIKTANHIRDPRTGEERIQECHFTYDGNKKVNFGLNYLVGMDLLPWRGTTSDWEQSLSSSNLLGESCSGNTYTITYNQEGFPATITTKWKDIETEKPIILRIEYKK